MRPKGLLITIDGPAGAGKSSIAKMLATELGYLYLDTGAMFRAVGFAAKQKGLSPDNKQAIAAICDDLSIELVSTKGGIRVILNGEDVTDFLRTPEMDKWAALVATIPEVRTCLLKRQRAIGANGGVVAEGRDTGSVVFPNADLKFFLTASAEIRAKRRYEELVRRGEKISYEDVLTQLIARDRQDKERKTAPLVIPDGAIVIDTSTLSLKEVFEHVFFEVKKTLKRKTKEIH